MFALPVRIMRYNKHIINFFQMVEKYEQYLQIIFNIFKRLKNNKLFSIKNLLDKL